MTPKPSDTAKPTTLLAQVIEPGDQPYIDAARALIKAGFHFPNRPKSAYQNYDLNLAQVDVLVALAGAPEATLTCSEIAEKTLITKGGITGVLDKLEARGLDRAHLDEITRLDELGYDNIWLTEHHFVEDGYNPSVLPIAAAIAVRTSRIRIGTFVLLLPFHDPVRVAEDAIVIDILSNGRFDLGVGQGYRAEEFAALNIPRAERSSRLNEGIDLIHRLLTQGEVSFVGKYNRVTAMTLYPRPVQLGGPPIWIGCRTSKATERAARMGFHLLATLGPDPAIPYRAALERFGRAAQDFNIAQLRAVHVARNADQAWNEAAPHLHYMMTHYGQWLAEAMTQRVTGRYGKSPRPRNCAPRRLRRAL